MNTKKNKAKRLQFSLHGVIVASTLFAVGLSISSQWGGPFMALVVMTFLSPLFVAVYIAVALAEEWITERMSR